MDSAANVAYRILNRKVYTGTEICGIRRLPCKFPSRKSNSNICYDKRDNISFGSLIYIESFGKKKYYAISTGELIKGADGKYYYEVWADLFDDEQTRIIATVFRTIDFTNRFKLIDI